MRGLALVVALALSYVSVNAAPFEAGAHQHVQQEFLGVLPHVNSVTTTRKIVNVDITCMTYKMKTSAGPLVAHVLLINPKSKRISLETQIANGNERGRIERTSSMASRTHAIAGINGGFFAVHAGNAPIGILMHDGKILHQHDGRPVLMIGKNNRIIIGDFDPQVAVASISASPLIMRNHKEIRDHKSANWRQRNSRIPASIVAQRDDGMLAFVAVDGRHPNVSVGMNQHEAFTLLRALGMKNAIMLDGGGSSTLVARVQERASLVVMNTPSDGRERPVADGLFVYYADKIQKAKRKIHAIFGRRT